MTEDWVFCKHREFAELWVNCRKHGCECKEDKCEDLYGGKMTVQIDRYEIITDVYTLNAKSIGIHDRLTLNIIMAFDTPNKELNRMFAEKVLAELNTGKYEEMINGDMGDV